MRDLAAAAGTAFTDRVVARQRAAEHGDPYDQLRSLVLDLHTDAHPGPARTCEWAACQHAAGEGLGGEQRLPTRIVPAQPPSTPEGTTS